MGVYFSAGCRWNLTGKLFISTSFGADTAVKAEAEARAKEALYGDQTFERVVKAANYNEAQEIARQGE